MADDDRTLEDALAEVPNRGEVYPGQLDLVEGLAKAAREWFDVTIRVEPRIVTPSPSRLGSAIFQDAGGAGVSQLDLLAGLDAGLCRYGLPKAGEPRLCGEAATHAACWLIPAAYLDGTLNPRAGSGRIECCRTHADYYASAWVPRYPAEVGSAWIDVLEIAAALDATAV